MRQAFPIRFLAVGFVAASVTGAATALASGNHHSAPMGGRSALMGGTGVALGVDGAGPFLNPATIVGIEGGRLAFAARFYRFSSLKFSDFYTPGPIDAQFGTSSFGETGEVTHGVHSIPDSVCYFFPPLGGESRRQRLSFCLTTLEEQQLALTAVAANRTANGARLDQNQHFDVRWSRFNLGPTWGIALGQLKLGASLMVSFTRYRQAILGSSVVESEVGSATTSSYESLVSASSWDVATRVGATYGLGKRITAGASVTLPLFHVLGSLRETQLSDSIDARHQWSGNGGFRATPPLEFRVGLGGEWESLRFEADVFVTPGSAHYVRGELDRKEIAVQSGAATRTASRLIVNERTHTTVNLALGAETFVTPRFSLLFGVQTDVNALEDLKPELGESRLFRTKLDYYRTGAGICSYTDYGDLMVGFRFDYGQGKAMPANTLSVPSGLGYTGVRDIGIMAVLAGSLSWRSIKQAVGEIGEVVSGEGGAPPKTVPQPLSKPKRKD
ncbi:MAG TPA: hypothetical protein VG937_32105 [Polyangiaceae bacterium]|nr:hypothetical protein [Polyangiaceae bacterium]